MKTYERPTIFAESRKDELSEAFWTFIGRVFIACFWIALLGGGIYGLVRFVKWAWQG